MNDEVCRLDANRWQVPPLIGYNAQSNLITLPNCIFPACIINDFHHCLQDLQNNIAKLFYDQLPEKLAYHIWSWFDWCLTSFLALLMAILNVSGVKEMNLGTMSYSFWCIQLSWILLCSHTNQRKLSENK